MPTSHPRVNVTLEPETYHILEAISKLEKSSLSSVVSKLVNLSLELAEDLALAESAQARFESFRRDDALTSEELLKWNKNRRKK